MLRTFCNKIASRPLRASRCTPTVEPLNERLAPAVIASFHGGILKIVGDSLGNTINVSRTAAGKILINNGAVPVVGGLPTVAKTSLIKVLGRGGNDKISLVETRGALPRAVLVGGVGHDVLTGGSGDDQLLGQAGRDTLFGKAGLDVLMGGLDNDLLIGGAANDVVLGDEGNDRMIWNPGDDTDLNDGGLGIDTVEVNGGNGAETFTVVANGASVRFERTDPAPFRIDIIMTENLIVQANGGDDAFSAGNGLAPLIKITVDGGAGNDTLRGGDGADVLLGGAGDDVFTWNPGDGSDVIEGQAGFDALQFNGSEADEHIDISANGRRVRFSRDVASVTMDMDEVEQIDFNAFGGADTIVVNQLAGTDVTQINLDLAGAPGGSAGDGQLDSVIVQGGSGDDVLNVDDNATGASVTISSAAISIVHAEAAADRLTINGLGGDDVVDASALAAGKIRYFASGGDGNDVLVGSDGDDDISAGAGDDVVIGGPGTDILDAAPGDDVVLP